MASFSDPFNCIALIERFNHVAIMRACGYDGIEANRKFRLIYVSLVDGDQIALSLMMRDDSLVQLFLPPRFRNVFHTDDLYRINESRVRLSVTVAQVGEESRHLELAFW
jgi:hypothetical protein